MADSKVSALTELTAFTGDETFYVVEDDDGTPASRRITVENLAAGLAARTEFSDAYAPAATPVPFKTVTRSAGDITVSTPTAFGTFQELAAESGGPGTGGFDLTLAAVVGDVLEATPTALLGTQAVDSVLDIRTIVSGSPVNGWAAQGAVSAGAPPYGPWYAIGGATPGVQRIGGSFHYTVVAGDIVSGQVTCRPYVAQSNTTGRIWYAGSSHLFQWTLKNLGQPTA